MPRKQEMGPIELPESEEPMELEHTEYKGVEKRMAIEPSGEERRRMEGEADHFARTVAEGARNKTEYDKLYSEAYSKKLSELERIKESRHAYKENTNLEEEIKKAENEIPDLTEESIEPFLEEEDENRRVA